MDHVTEFSTYVDSGDISGLYGNCTGLSGDLDACDISNDDRRVGINITDVVVFSY